MESSKQQQQQSFPFDMGLGLYHEHNTATAFLDPSSSTNDDISFELDFLSSSPLGDITPQQPDLLAPSLTSYFPIEQQQHSPLQDNGQPYCSPSFLFSHLNINQTEQQQQQHSMETQKEEEDMDEEGTIECYNCKVISTPLWRRTPDRAHILCNACGLYYKQYKRHRPVRIWQRATRWLGIEGYYQNPYQQQQQQQYTTTTTTPPIQQQQCANCHQTDTPLWRKNSRGQSICNACGLFFKLHHRDRPMELNKTNSQRRRRRRREPLAAGTEEMFMGLRADMSRDEMQLVLRIMEERCAFLKAMLGNNNNSSSTNDDRQLPSAPSAPQQQQQQQQEIFGYM
ncbi:predicted protein [Lichtheimia corymbifera JMRC:FSU:9682]|uniref:GATA-type domain-containing protein n=1 Tax=Lichtheimia corymbifera JMRC:FSU:9682 TaxID=1263082 RepID=A0A068RHR5_9FUNG|nr:predicted protein [Lichtheimia corymbifera JMRC:FSU:9682]